MGLRPVDQDAREEIRDGVHQLSDHEDGSDDSHIQAQCIRAVDCEIADQQGVDCHRNAARLPQGGLYDAHSRIRVPCPLLPCHCLSVSPMYCCFVFHTAPTITERQKSEDSILALSRQFWRISVREGMHSPGAVRNFVIDFINFSQFVQTLFKPRCYHDPCPKGERQSSRKAGKPRLFHFTTPPFCRLPSPGAGAFLSCGIGSPKAQCDNDSAFSAAFCVLKILHSGHIPFTLCPNQRHNRLLFCNHQKDDGFHLLNETAILFHKRFPLGNRS